MSESKGAFGEGQITCLQMRFSSCVGWEQGNVNEVTDCQLSKTRLGAVKLAVCGKANRRKSQEGRAVSLG